MPERVDRQQREKIFGPPTYRYADDAYGVHPSRLVTITSPWGLRVRVHHLIVEALDEGWRRARRANGWRPARIDSFAPRAVRGSSEPSLHAYGLACDYFDTTSPTDVWGPQDAPPAVWTAALESVGFYGGYRFDRRADWPHIEWAAGMPPQSFPSAGTSCVPDGSLLEVDVQITPYKLTIPTDADGSGNAPAPFTLDRIIGFLPGGIRPNVDGRNLVPQIAFAPEGDHTVVSVEEWDPRGTCVVYLRVAT